MEDFSKIDKLIASSKIEQAIKELILINTDSELKNELLGQLEKLNDLKKRERIGIISFDNARLIQNGITFSVIELSTRVQKAISKILVIYIGFCSSLKPSLNIEEEFESIKSIISINNIYSIHNNIITSLNELNTILAKPNNYILHFACHGEIEGLHLSDGNNLEKFENNLTIAEFLSPFSNKIQCVILNACLSKSLGGMLRKSISNIIRMENKIRDKSSINYSKKFYHYLRENISEIQNDNTALYELAHEYSVNTLGLNNNPDKYIIDYVKKINI